MREMMRDAAFAANIPAAWRTSVGTTLTGIKTVAGYLGGGNQFHEWSAGDWEGFPKNKKLPIFVRTTPGTPGAEADAFAVMQQLYALNVPKQVFTALDLETAVDPVYVTNYGKVMHYFGFNVLVYGSASTLFGNPPLDGYWVADYAGIGPFSYNHANVAATQYANGKNYDSSTVRWKYQMRKWWI